MIYRDYLKYDCLYYGDNMKKLIIEFNDDNYDKYITWYFKQHPKAKNKPIKNCVHPSLNEWQNMHHQAKNILKQNWKDYVTMIIKDLKINDFNIDKCEVDVHIIRPTRIKADLDNRSIKFIQDALVLNNVITEDNYTVITKLTYSAEYIKGIQKMILTIKY